MSLRQTAEEMSNAMMVRQRLIERARDALRGDDLHGAVIDVVNCLQHIQDNEKRLLELHAECHGLIEYCGKVLAGDAMRRPISVILGTGQEQRADLTRKDEGK